ncbi:DUF397 domain-containing protein [Streptomyces sp. NPDC093225]|uniref:DUF397 domain-containing protein n=1 Tax=Streptomyces sp. NPDC093225 TaxID=3366034 RepID=UPI00381EE124
MTISKYDLNTAEWFKSSYSGGGGDDCVEVGRGLPTHVPVRDSKDPRGPKLVFPAAAWEAFVDGIQDGSLHPTR